MSTLCLVSASIASQRQVFISLVEHFFIYSSRVFIIYGIFKCHKVLVYDVLLSRESTGLDGSPAYTYGIRALEVNIDLPHHKADRPATTSPRNFSHPCFDLQTITVQSNDQSHPEHHPSLRQYGYA